MQLRCDYLKRLVIFSICSPNTNPFTLPFHRWLYRRHQLQSGILRHGGLHGADDCHNLCVPPSRLAPGEGPRQAAVQGLFMVVHGGQLYLGACGSLIGGRIKQL